MYKRLNSWLASLVITACVAVQLVACSSGGRGNDGGFAAAEDGTLELSGSVGGGPLVGAAITVSSSSGTQVGSVVSKKDASYRTNIRAESRDYPLLLSVNDGFDLVTGSAPDFTMYSVVMNRQQQSANINPFSTLIIKIARLMPGGINESNINTAMRYVTERLGFGLNQKAINDPVTTRITDANAANLIKASVALGEVVRRTRDAASASGIVVTGDDVVDAIAADMIDGYLDGTGAAAVNPSLSAVARVVSAQVLVEVQGNNLRVGGIVATGVIDAAIATTRHNASSSLVADEEHIPADMLNQAVVDMDAVRVPDAGPAESDVVSVVNAVPVNSSRNGEEALLPADTSAMPDTAVFRPATVPNEEAVAVNRMVHAGGSGSAADSSGTDTGATVAAGIGGTGDSVSGETGGAGSGPANTVPVISGSPTGSVQANARYAFQPNATDNDGNVLAFSIANKPGWASFSDTTGRLGGIPADGDTGSYNNILISVTDGLDTANLQAFSIHVDADPGPTESYTVSWKASVMLPDETPRSATVTDVPVGGDYVVMNSYDDAGRESASSAETTRSAQ